MYHLMEPEYQRQLARDARRRIQELIPADAGTPRRLHSRVVTGDPAAAISRVAAEVDADLLLIGATSRGAIGRLVFGLTAARVIRTAGRPVLAIPQLAGKAVAHGAEGDQLAAAA
jgi:nucleotide-binding universal stress UspA family protein